MRGCCAARAPGLQTPVRPQGRRCSCPYLQAKVLPVRTEVGLASMLEREQSLVQRMAADVLVYCQICSCSLKDESKLKW